MMACRLTVTDPLPKPMLVWFVTSKCTTHNWQYRRKVNACISVVLACIWSYSLIFLIFFPCSHSRYTLSLRHNFIARSLVHLLPRLNLPTVFSEVGNLKVATLQHHSFKCAPVEYKENSTSRMSVSIIHGLFVRNVTTKGPLCCTFTKLTFYF